MTRVLSISLCILFATVNSHANDQDSKLSREEVDFFEIKIRPVLVRECYSCHSDQAGQRKGGLRLDTKARCEIGGENGPAVVAGDLDDSLLWNAINHVDFAMPPRKKLSEREIANFKIWIEMGAPDPRVSKAKKIKSTVTDADVRKGRKFWSFVKPKLQSIPVVSSSNWERTEIDYFVASKLSEEGLYPSEDADPNTLLRRLSIDLTGLPPNPEQVKWFVDRWEIDPDSAIQKVVDKMLASERFGERWGRHWLDVARYAESTGREINATFPNAWRYRDYVIDSFNEDKPYDQFIREQIAGDLLPAKTDSQWAEQLIATGFLAIGPKSLTEQNARQFNLDLIDEQIDVTSRVILGVSLSCARCHDHKFDPIQQKDYYAVAGIFESTETHYGTLNAARNRRPSSHLILPISDPSQFDPSFSKSEVKKIRNEIEQLNDKLDEYRRERRTQRNTVNANQNFANITRTVSRIAALETKIDSVDENGEAVSFCMGVQDKDRPKNSQLLIRGEFDQPDGEVERGFISVLTRGKPRIKKSSSGRLELAKWLTDKRNPLTARVMANRIWQHMFGEGIVRTPENFGATGLQPTHPELLDYLAIEFMKNNWSVKNLVRQIAVSRAYRMDSKFDASRFESDPENFFIWRHAPRQLDAETLRDSMLYASGQIELQRPRASTVAKAGTTFVRDGKLFGTNNSRDESMMMQSRYRRRGDLKIYEVDEYNEFRSVFLPIVRDSLPRSLEVFDFAEPGMVVGKRDVSNTPSQGLYLLNNEFVLKQSKAMARRLIENHESTTDQIRHAFLLAYGREATQQQIALAQSFYDQFDVRLTFRERRSGTESVELKKLAAMTHSILASAEFRFAY